MNPDAVDQLTAIISFTSSLTSTKEKPATAEDPTSGHGKVREGPTIDDDFIALDDASCETDTCPVASCEDRNRARLDAPSRAFLVISWK